jgi:Protein of unknown function (DUF2786)
MTNRDMLLEKIRALLSKTAANGCTEAEALAALDNPEPATANSIMHRARQAAEPVLVRRSVGPFPAQQPCAG